MGMGNMACAAGRTWAVGVNAGACVTVEIVRYVGRGTLKREAMSHVPLDSHCESSDSDAEYDERDGDECDDVEQAF